jgi:hypothetical protein
MRAAARERVSGDRIRAGAARRTRLPSAAATLFLLVVGGAGPAAAQIGGCQGGTRLGFGPALLDDAEGERRLGAAITAVLCSSGHDLRRSDDGADTGAFPFSHVLAADAELTLLPDGGLMPVRNHLSARAGLLLSLSGPAEVVECTPAMTDAECAEAMTRTGATAFDYGFVSLEAEAQMEASGGWDERNLVAGAEVRYGHVKSWIPSLVLSYDLVTPVASELRDAAGVGDDLHGRWRLQGYLTHRLGPVTGTVEASAFKANGLAPALDALGWDEGAWVAATLGWAVERSVADIFAIDRLYVGYTDGQPPTQPLAGESWTVGLELTLDGG